MSSNSGYKSTSPINIGREYIHVEQSNEIIIVDESAMLEGWISSDKFKSLEEWR